MVTWDGAGNIPPEFAICRALVNAGHDVHVLTHDSLRDRTREIGANFRPICHAGQLDSQDPNESMQDVIDQVIIGDLVLSDVDDAIDAIAPGLVIADSMMLLVVTKFAQSSMPSVVIHHTLADFLYGGLMDQMTMMIKDDIDKKLLARGLTPYPRPIDAIAENDLILTATYWDFDQSSRLVPDNFFHIGPLRRGPGDKEGEIDRRFPNVPLVVVSLSTSFMEQHSLLQRIADALATLNVEGLITTGPAVEPSSLSVAENTSAIEFIAHKDVLPHADLLITHAGHGTVMAGATFGTPMLCIPMGRDQPAVAERAKKLGLAHVCEPGSASEEIAAAITNALGDSKMAASGRAFADRVRSHPGLVEAIERIEGLLK